MPLRIKLKTLCAVALTLWLSSASIHLWAQQTQAGQPTTPDVQQAMAELKKDPNLAQDQKIRSLKWKSKSSEKENNKQLQLGWLSWLVGFFQWLAQGGRILIWTIVIVLAGLIVVFLIRLIRGYERNGSYQQAKVPTHVRELDIRPETLPRNIGSTAWNLWQQSEQRDALSLLYRGLLSRLVHQHGVPIRDASTEAECLALAKLRLPDQRIAYVAQLLTIWSHAIYGAQLPSDEQVQTLCDGFDGALNATHSPAERAA